MQYKCNVHIIVHMQRVIITMWAVPVIIMRQCVAMFISCLAIPEGVIARVLLQGDGPHHRTQTAGVIQGRTEALHI